MLPGIINIRETFFKHFFFLNLIKAKVSNKEMEKNVIYLVLLNMIKSGLKVLLKTVPAVCRKQKKTRVSYNNDTNVCFNIEFKSVASYKALLLVPVFSFKVSIYCCVLSVKKLIISL